MRQTWISPPLSWLFKSQYQCIANAFLLLNDSRTWKEIQMGSACPRRPIFLPVWSWMKDGLILVEEAVNIHIATALVRWSWLWLVTNLVMSYNIDCTGKGPFCCKCSNFQLANRSGSTWSQNDMECTECRSIRLQSCCQLLLTSAEYGQPTQRKPYHWWWWWWFLSEFILHTCNCLTRESIGLCALLSLGVP